MIIINHIKTWLNPSAGLSRDICKMQQAYLRSEKALYLYYNKIIHSRYGCCIAPSAQISNDVEFPHPVGIVIGEGAVVGRGCVIYQNVTLGRADRDIANYPTLGENCIVYAGATIVGNVRLAPGTIVGAGAVVTKGSTMENDVLVGMPARSKFASGGG